MASPARFRTMAAAAVGTAALLLVILSVRGASHGPLLAGLADLAADPWGLATLADLVIGLVFVAIWMLAVEARPRRLLLWLPLLACLGNIATALYLLERLRRAIAPRDWLTARL